MRRKHKFRIEACNFRFYNMRWYCFASNLWYRNLRMTSPWFTTESQAEDWIDARVKKIKAHVLSYSCELTRRKR